MCAKLSMMRAVAEVKVLPEYATNGKVCILGHALTLLVRLLQRVYTAVITDGRHDSTAKAFHTTVPCLSGRYLERNYFGEYVLNIP